ncbi:MAG: alpha/beta fold hydrolase [Pseudomonadales bacterium]|nr:alpha/beta fold hydrolase [Pseudomonadales bacterium]
MEQPSPFTVAIPDTALVDLKQRLALTRLPDAELVPDWSQGLPRTYLEALLRYWAEDYDWRRCEALLNSWPQFTVPLDGPGGTVPVHFIHLRSPEPNARPLLLSHGWPGSILEFRHVLAPLTDPVAHGGRAEDAFHVVAPSLPGFAFSGKPTVPGWTVEAMAKAFDQLMTGLGYERYFAQGGDWGSIITSALGELAPPGLAGIHVTMPIVTPDPETAAQPNEEEQDALAGLAHYQQWDSAYARIQGTRPQTLAYGLADSPAGQAAWIIEKFWSWMDCDDDPESVLSKDELLDNVMLYWLNNAGASSARIYWESFNKVSQGPLTLPSAISLYPKEIFRTSERWARRRFTDLRRFNRAENGGHFAALECPEHFVAELRASFALMTLAEA